MSIYNGFSTRQLEAQYNKAIYSALYLLQMRIAKLFRGGTPNPLPHLVEKFDDIKFGKIITKLYARMFSMETVKYLPPKFSYALRDLAEILGVFEVKEEELRQRKGFQSDTESNFSFMT